VSALQWVGVVMLAVILLIVNAGAIISILDGGELETGDAWAFIFAEIVIVGLLLATGAIGCTNPVAHP